MSHAVRLPCDEAAIRAAAQESAEPAARVEPCGPWVLAATILGSSLAFIDGTVVSIALPAIARDFGARGADVQWVVEAYALPLSALLLVGGSLGDRFGRRRIYALGVLIFTIASVACGLSPSIGALVAARAAQGVGGALLVPGSLALISASFEPERRGRAIGTWSGFSGIAAALGPLVGGWLVGISWRWAFFLNVPIAILVILLLRRVPESRNPRAGPIDVPGAILATVGLGGVVYALIESTRLGWSNPLIAGGLVTGIAALAAFIVVERRSAAPMLPPGLFRSPTFAGANALTLFLYGALSCVFFFFPLNLIQVQGYAPFAAGAAMLPFIVVVFALSGWSGGLVARFGARRPLILGPLVVAAGFVLLALPGLGGSYWRSYFPGIVVTGLGMALSIAPLTTAVMNAAGEENAGAASGVNNAVSRAAGLLSIALLGILLTGVFDRELDRRIGGLGLDPPVARAILSQKSRLAAAEPPAGLGAADAAAVREAIGLSFLSGFRATALASAGLALLGSLCAGIWIRDSGPPRRSPRSTP